MKKLLLVMLSVIIALSTAMMFGCGETSIFDGNYQEVGLESTEMSTFSEAVISAEQHQLQLGSGMKVKVVLDVKEGDDSMYVKMDMDLLEVEQSLQMQGSMNMKMQGMDTTATLWHKDNYMYMNASAQGQTVKRKMPVTIDEFIGDQTGGMLNMDFSFIETLENYSSQEGVKFYLEDGEQYKKFKIEVPQTQVEGMTMEASVYFLFDADYKLVGVKSKVVNDMGAEGKFDVALEITPWEGTINLPSDLDSYIEMGW